MGKNNWSKQQNRWPKFKKKWPNPVKKSGITLQVREPDPNAIRYSSLGELFLANWSCEDDLQACRSQRLLPFRELRSMGELIRSSISGAKDQMLTFQSTIKQFGFHFQHIWKTPSEKIVKCELMVSQVLITSVTVINNASYKAKGKAKTYRFAIHKLSKPYLKLIPRKGDFGTELLASDREISDDNITFDDLPLNEAQDIPSDYNDDCSDNEDCPGNEYDCPDDADGCPDDDNIPSDIKASLKRPIQSVAAFNQPETKVKKLENIEESKVVDSIAVPLSDYKSGEEVSSKETGISHKDDTNVSANEVDGNLHGETSQNLPSTSQPVTLHSRDIAPPQPQLPQENKITIPQVVKKKPFSIAVSVSKQGTYLYYIFHNSLTIGAAQSKILSVARTGAFQEALKEVNTVSPRVPTDIDSLSKTLLQKGFITKEMVPRQLMVWENRDVTQLFQICLKERGLTERSESRRENDYCISSLYLNSILFCHGMGIKNHYAKRMSYSAAIGTFLFPKEPPKPCIQT